MKEVTSITSETIKSPRLLSLLSRTLNELPSNKPWAAVHVTVLIVISSGFGLGKAADETATQGPKSITCWPSRILSVRGFLIAIDFVEETAFIL